MGILSLKNMVYSAEEYLDIDKNSQDRYEYEYGYIWAMAGTTLIHNLLVQNLILIFRDYLKKKKSRCKIFNENIRLEVIRQKVYYYPDLILTCHPLDLQEKTTVRNASLVIEVVSESSFKMDLSHKLDNYLTMPSLLYYVVIEQDAHKVRVLEKKGKEWVYTFYTELSDILLLPQLEMEIPLGEIYENVEIEPSNLL